MSAVISPPLPIAPAPGPRKWTRDEYCRMADLGFFRGQRAELIGGEIVVMSPQNWPHASTTARTAELLRRVFAAMAWVRSQLPLMLGLSSDPEPDVSVVPGRLEDYTNHPTTALLVAEISDTSLAFDRGNKASLYAAANIADYWVVNLNDRQVEVFRDPQPDAAQPSGARYMQVTIYRSGASIAPLAMPQALVAVADLLA
jgi:Uma2 family endonuclease